MLLWHGQPVVFKGEDDCARPVLALGDATRKTGAFGYPEAIFARVKDDLLPVVSG